MSLARFVNIKTDTGEVRDQSDENNDWVQIGQLIEKNGIHFVHIGIKHYKIYRDARIINGRINPDAKPGWYLVIEE